MPIGTGNVSRNSPKSDLPEECDIVMKGGITSGVIYPRAVRRFSDQYTLRSIGGTSAGAIAAVGAAAAEYGRTSGNNPGAFPQLETMATELGKTETNGKTVLFNLFQPQPKTRPYFDILVKSFLSGGQKLFGKIIKAFVLMLKNFPITTLVSIVVTLLVVFLFLMFSTGATGSNFSLPTILAAAWGGETLIILLDVLFVLIVILPARFFLGINNALKKNGYGLCNGMRGSGAGDPLSIWLHNQFQDLAGRERKGHPLTFGDLWTCRNGRVLADDFEEVLNGNDCDVELKTVTTNVTQGRPFAIPFEQQTFFFKEDELAKYFPREVVNWMVENQRHLKSGNHKEAPEGYCSLPLPKDMPVLVAARMSLSYPVLLSAVPLYAYDFRKHPEKLTKCWFSDGGECSNFPIHFFDSPLPSRPTFGLNLLDWEKGKDSRFDNDDPALEGVHLVESNSAGKISPQNWQPIKNILDLLLKIFNTAANWRDNTQSTVPGFCDRIAHIGVQKHEGGLNLNMEKGVIKGLADRGYLAADLISTRFTSPHNDESNKMSWDNHRWIRFLTTMMLNQKQFAVLKERLEGFQEGENDFHRLLFNPPAYKDEFNKDDYKEAVDEMLKAMEAWLEIIRDHDSSATLRDDLFISRAPKPHPILRRTARI